MTEPVDIIYQISLEGDEKINELRKRNTELFQSIDKNKMAIDELKKANKELNKDYAANSEQIARNNQTIKELTSTNQKLNTEINQNTKLIQSNAGSQNELASRISKLSAYVNELTDDQLKNTEEGRKAAEQLKALRDEYREQQMALGNTAVNVGNYMESILNATDALDINTGYVGQAMQAYRAYAVSAQEAGRSTNLLKFALDLLAKNPILLIIGAVVAVFKLLQSAIQRNMQAFDDINQAIAPFKVILDKVMSTIGELVGLLAEGLANAINFIVDLFGDATKSVGEYQDALKTLDDVEDAWYNKKLRDKQLQETVNRLMEVANDKRKTAAERVAALQKAQELEKKAAVESAELQKKELDATVVQLKSKYGIQADLVNANLEITQQALDKLTDEDKNALLEQLSNYIDFNNRKSEIDKTGVKKLSALQNEIATDDKQAIQERQKRAEEAAKEAEELNRKLQDALLGAMQEGKDKELAALKLSHERELAEIKGNGEKQVEIRAALTQTYLAEQAKIEEQYREEAIQKEVDQQARIIQLRLDAVTKGSDEEFKLRIEQLEFQKSIELQNEEATEYEKTLIRAKYAALESDVAKEQEAQKKAKRDEALQQEADDLKARNETALLNLQLQGESTLQAEAEIKRREIDSLQIMDQESADEFLARKTQLQLDLQDLENKIAEEEKAKQEQRLEIFRQFSNAISNVLQIASDNSEAAAAFSKVVALYQIGVDTAKAISGAVASGSSIPFPGNLLAIATGIATVTANILQAKKILSSTKETKGVDFKKALTGDVVTGGIRGVDSVPYMLAPGEAIVNPNSASMFAPLISAINTAGGGKALGYDQSEGSKFLAAAFAEALQSMPAPRVSVDEINTVQNRVRVSENLAKL